MRRGPMLAFFLVITFATLPATTKAQNPPADSGGILQTILLPALAQTLRDKGIPAQEVQAAVTSAEQNHLPPSETADILRQTAVSVDENGPIDNFGAFVQQELRAGLRGRDLADAIRAEHARRGIGKGKRLEARSGPRGGPGAAERGPEQERRPAAAGQGRAQERGPAAAGKAGARGQSSQVKDSAGRGGTQKERGRKPARRDTVPPPHGGGR